ncbi:carbohydrate kinase family protein [Microbacterium enclense]|uniref:carbohydrate kinase family protein n=1 Tax=Microbacterium enclense TaxID=993073 RepID=UPI003D7326A0
MADTDAVIDLLVVGELCVDVIVSLDDTPVRFGQHERIVDSTLLTMGSSSAITACGAAALGARVSLVGVRGEDSFGEYIARQLNELGVDTTSIRIDPSVPTGSSVHLTRPDGDRAILTALGSIGRTVAADVPTSLLSRSRHLHIGSYFLQSGLWSDAAALLSEARGLGVTTSLDGNFDPAEEWDSGIRDVLTEVEVFFGNEEELMAVADVSDVDDAVRSLLALMPVGATVVCKRGASGATAFTRLADEVTSIHAGVPDAPGPVIDTVGAGDTLAAGYLVARIGGADSAMALALGVASGTASTRGAGGVSAQPDRDVAEGLAAAVQLA